ncbi:hypothetical protein SRHO_G00192820 [Serrasalmus rhombeus]
MAHVIDRLRPSTKQESSGLPTWRGAAVGEPSPWHLQCFFVFFFLSALLLFPFFTPVLCVASTCLYDLPTMPGHAPDEVEDGLLRDLLPDLD